MLDASKKEAINSGEDINKSIFLGLHVMLDEEADDI